jgi:hypothetical protein
MNHLLKAPFCIHPKTGKSHNALIPVLVCNVIIRWHALMLKSEALYTHACPFETSRFQNRCIHSNTFAIFHLVYSNNCRNNVCHTMHPIADNWLLFIFLGRVCVPIDPSNCDDFDPAAVPTLSQVWSIEPGMRNTNISYPSAKHHVAMLIY